MPSCWERTGSRARRSLSLHSVDDLKLLGCKGFRGRKIVGGWFYRCCMVSGSGSGERPVWDAVGCLTAAVDGLAGAALWRVRGEGPLHPPQGVGAAARGGFVGAVWAGAPGRG